MAYLGSFGHCFTEYFDLGKTIRKGQHKIMTWLTLSSPCVVWRVTDMDEEEITFKIITVMGSSMTFLRISIMPRT